MSRAQHDNILISTQYDHDAASLLSTSDQASDSEDEYLKKKTRTTLELDDYDASVLREEEERENLLTGKGTFNGVKHLFGGSSSHAGVEVDGKKTREQRRKGQKDFRRGVNRESAEHGQLMFEMEEGFKDTSSKSSSSDSLRWDRHGGNNHETKVSQESKHPWTFS